MDMNEYSARREALDEREISAIQSGNTDEFYRIHSELDVLDNEFQSVQEIKEPSPFGNIARKIGKAALGLSALAGLALTGAAKDMAGSTLDDAVQYVTDNSEHPEFVIYDNSELSTIRDCESNSYSISNLDILDNRLVFNVEINGENVSEETLENYSITLNERIQDNIGRFWSFLEPEPLTSEYISLNDKKIIVEYSFDLSNATASKYNINLVNKNEDTYCQGATGGSTSFNKELSEFFLHSSRHYNLEDVIINYDPETNEFNAQLVSESESPFNAHLSLVKSTQYPGEDTYFHNYTEKLGGKINEIIELEPSENYTLVIKSLFECYPELNGSPSISSLKSYTNLDQILENKSLNGVDSDIVVNIDEYSINIKDIVWNEERDAWKINYNLFGEDKVVFSTPLESSDLTKDIDKTYLRYDKLMFDGMGGLGSGGVIADNESILLCDNADEYCFKWRIYDRLQFSHFTDDDNKLKLHTMSGAKNRDTKIISYEYEGNIFTEEIQIDVKNWNDWENRVWYDLNVTNNMESIISNEISNISEHPTVPGTQNKNQHFTIHVPEGRCNSPAYVVKFSLDENSNIQNVTKSSWSAPEFGKPLEIIVKEDNKKKNLIYPIGLITGAGILGPFWYLNRKRDENLIS